MSPRSPHPNLMSAVKVTKHHPCLHSLASTEAAKCLASMYTDINSFEEVKAGTKLARHASTLVKKLGLDLCIARTIALR